MQPWIASQYFEFGQLALGTKILTAKNRRKIISMYYSSWILEIFPVLCRGEGLFVDDLDNREAAYDELFEWFLIAPTDPATRCRNTLLL